MADPENASSKKRAAGRQISRDNPELEDDTTESETGTFQRASEEVLATRRIVKVRRQQHSSGSPSNPFSGIRLVAATKPNPEPDACAEPQNPTDKSALEESNSTNDKLEQGSGIESCTVVDELNETGDDIKPSEEPEASTNEIERNIEEEKEVQEPEGQTSEKPEEAEEEAQKEAGARSVKEAQETENDEGKESSIKKEARVAPSPFSSFQQLSNSQNAFTGFSGTGIAASSFSFGSSEGPAFSSFSFASSNNGASSFPLFGFSGPDSAKTAAGGRPPLQEVPVETGEENEKTVFTADATLYEYSDGSWKERGKGEIKVNTSMGGEKARLIMRARGNYRLILNSNLYPDMTLANMDKKGISFSCINTAGEGKDGLTTCALKFKDASFVAEFCVAVMEHKGKNAPAAALKTPENSPKASDE